MLMADNRIFSLTKVVLITTCTLCMMSSLTVFKYSAKKVLCIFGVYLLWVLASSGAILALLPYNAGIRIFLLTISAPAVFLAYRMDKDSPTQAVFNYTTQINFSLLLCVLALVINTAIDGNQYTDLAIRTLLYGLAIHLEYRFLRKPFRQLAEVITSGWGILSLIPVFFCLLIAMLATVPVHFSESPVNVLYIFAIAVTMLVIYAVVYQSLMRQYRLQLLMRDKDILRVQISSMNKQAEAVLAAEEKLKIMRHDARHFSELMSLSLQQGSAAQAEEILSGFAATLEHNKTKCYCSDHVLNSMLVSYFEQAEKENISIKVSFTPPPADWVDITAFSVMLANALENALEACREETAGCTIELKSRIFNEQYLLELGNTCEAAVLFDRDDIPISQKGEGHGIGTLSILAFAKQHNATVRFENGGHRFAFQIMLNLENGGKRCR